MSLALYRTHRPGRFADVVGQEHVTGPLMRALAADRVHHAYLFSGPRGCGKTSSARILARSLNCEQGPTPEPCGVCRSCVELAPNGPGSMDVIELDAATHGLVDDARDLREKAHFSPVASRRKVYIIDEAHQLGPGAANALLKIIEEPPPHLTFVFATTAPDKLLGTIRSRTHHYPFRLVPSRTLQQHLARVASQEGVAVEPAALSLVARAGAGSVRDALSVLGQLMAGSGQEGVTYAAANALLGFTPAALLDEVVDAVAASDGATLFGALDRVMETGHDPRRFLTDLLERFRDLLVLQSVPDAASVGLLEAPDDEVAAMAGQATRVGAADLVRAADVVDAGITAMKGATPTRLQLELVCARLLLPGADSSTDGLAARLDRMERRLAIPSGDPGAQASAAAGAGGRGARDGSGADSSAARPGAPAGTGGPAGGGAGGEPGRAAASTSAAVAAEAEADRAVVAAGAAAGAETGAVVGAVSGAAAAEALVTGGVDMGGAGSDGDAGAEPAALGGAALRVADLRRQWPDILDLLKQRRKFTWILLSEHAQVVGLDDGRLQLAFDGPGPRSNFTGSGHDELVRQAIIDRLGLDLKVEAVVGGTAPGGDAPVGAGSATGATGSLGPAGSGPVASSRGEATPAGTPAVTSRPASGSAPRAAGSPGASRPAAAESDVAVPADDPVARDAARAGRRGGAGRGGVRRGSGPAAGTTGPASPGRGSTADDPAAGAHPDDADLDDAGISHRELLERAFGATVVSEVEHD